MGHPLWLLDVLQLHLRQSNLFRDAAQAENASFLVAHRFLAVNGLVRLGLFVASGAHLGRKFPCEGRDWLRGLLVHLSTAVFLSAIHIAAATALRILIRPFDVWSDTNPFLIQYQGELRNFFLFDFVVYWAILGVGYAFDYRERYREREAQPPS